MRVTPGSSGHQALLSLPDEAQPDSAVHSQPLGEQLRSGQAWQAAKALQVGADVYAVLFDPPTVAAVRPSPLREHIHAASAHVYAQRAMPGSLTLALRLQLEVWGKAYAGIPVCARVEVGSRPLGAAKRLCDPDL